MLLKINGSLVADTLVTLSEPEGKIHQMWDWLNDKANYVIQKEADLVMSPLHNSLKSWASDIVATLNAMSTDIITLGVVVCGMGMMFGPILNQPSATWTGRLVAVFIGGTIWRICLTT